MDPDGLLAELYDDRAVAILRTDDYELARAAMRAAVRGGFRWLEFTRACPRTFELIEEFAAEPDLVVGVGTALSARDARDAVAAGARFVVSPVTDEEVIGAAVQAGAIAVPGARTPTEMLRAVRAGAALQKLFPAPADGPAYLRALLGPMPFLRVVPTSGVHADNAAAWLQAGAWAVGFVGSLFELVEDRGDVSRIF